MSKKYSTIVNVKYELTIIVYTDFQIIHIA